MAGDRKRKPATDVAHLGRDPKQHLGAVSTPVYHATTILFDTVAELEAAERGQYPGVTYGLHGLPTVTDPPRLKTGGSFASASRLCSRRGPTSFLTSLPAIESGTGEISAAKASRCWAAAAF